MDMEALLGSAQVARGYMKQRIEDLSHEDLLHVPDGADNNVLWNLGHIVLSHYRLVYRPAGATVPVPETWNEWFLPGTSPGSWTDEGPAVGEVLDQFHGQFERIGADHNAGLFDAYKPFELKSGAKLSSAEEAMAFNLMHEGIHIGAVIALRHQMGLPDEP
jgi:hypothetical protein